MIYLDHNASAPLHPSAREAMLPWLGQPGNAFSAHGVGRRAAAAIEDAREVVAGLAGVAPKAVIFTSGATEANATVLSRGRWLVSATEHPSVLSWAAGEIPVDSHGVLDLPFLHAHAGDFDGISVMLANNETGVVQPIAEVAAIARSHGLRLHVDASQAPGRVPLVPADFVTLSAHKLGGPQGIGALLTRHPVEPLLRGGPQERGQRAGTHNVAAIVGFGAAVRTLELFDPTLRDRLETGLLAAGGRIAGRGAPRIPNTSCVGFPGVDTNDLVVALDLAGISVSAGSACASGSPEPSHVLRAMGFVGSAVRFSLGPANSPADIDTTLARLPSLLLALGMSP